VEQHCDAVAVSDQEDEMDAEPGEPGREAGEVGFPDLADAASASNRRHAALVVIVENAAGLIADAPHDLRRRVFSRLDCNLRDSGKRRSILLKMCQVTENENLGMPRNIEPIIHEDASAAVGRRTKRLSQMRGWYTRRPENHRGIDLLLADMDDSRLQVGDHGAGVDFNPQ